MEIIAEKELGVDLEKGHSQGILIMEGKTVA